MSTYYNFKDQEQLLEIALQICEDYEATEFSFGGGTLLSSAYYQHRMSYDVDIFTEDFSFIQTLIDNKHFIAKSLGIDEHSIEASSSAITFILSNHGAGLKLDFLYGESITDNPYSYINVLNQENLKVQTPEEVIARKIKYREILTVRDYVDFAYVQEKQNMMKELQKQTIDNVDIERYIDITDQFKNMSSEFLEAELELLDISFNLTRDLLAQNINSIILPENSIQIIYDEDFEVVSVDNFNLPYIAFAKEYGINYSILDTSISELEEKVSEELTYKTILKISPTIIKQFLEK